MNTTSKEQKKDFAIVANFRNKNEKASWLRKKRNLESLVDKIRPIEDEILILTTEKMKLIDEMNTIRETMTEDCIHPQDYLVHYGKYIKCRFCENKIVIHSRD